MLAFLKLRFFAFAVILSVNSKNSHGNVFQTLYFGQFLGSLAANVLRLCEEADFGALNFQHSTKVDAR